MPLTTSLIGFILDKMFLYQLGATLVTFAIIRVFLFYQRRQKRFQLFKYYGLPGPEPDLIGGNLGLFLQDDARYKIDAYCQKKFGKIFAVFIGDEPTLVISDLELLRKIFFENIKSFKERTKLFLDMPITHSILFAPYNRWKPMRKVMSPPFSSFQMRGSESVQFIEDSIKLMLDYIDDKINSSAEKVKPGRKGKIVLDIQDLMKATALHMISSMAILLPNVQVKENEENVKSLDSFLDGTEKGAVLSAIRFPFINVILNFIATHFEYDRTIALIHRGLNKRLDEELERLKSNKKRLTNEDVPSSQTKLINVLIRLHHEGKLSREEVISNADAVLFAGYDTTSTTLTYAFYVLGKYTNIQEKLREDLLMYGIESEYLEQVLNETMRMYPTVISFTSRLATETVELDGLVIPQGTKVVYNSWLIFRNPEVWPEPSKFDPERFKPGIEIHPCAFAPFGLSDRKCIGYQLAKLEMKMVICDTLLRYRVKLISPQELEIISHASVLTKPRDKVLVEMEKL